MPDITVTFAADTEKLVRGTEAGVDALTRLAGSVQSLAPDLASSAAASESAAAGLIKLGSSAAIAANSTVALNRTIAEQSRAAAEDGTRSAEKAAALQLKSFDEVTQAARRGSQERIADAERELALASSLGEAGAALQIQAQKRVTEAQREAAAEQLAIRRNAATTEIELGRLKMAETKAELAVEVEQHKITAAQKVAIERDLARQLEALEIQELTAAQQGLDQESLQYKELANRKLVTAQQLRNQLAALDREEAQDAKRAAEQDAASWRSAIGEITGAEDTFIRDVLTKRQSLAKSLEQMSAQLALREIADDAKYYTSKLLYNALGLASDRLTDQGGVLAHAASEMTKTAETRTGVAARTAIENTSQTTWLGQVATRIAQWLGLETSNTAATSAADAQRTIVDTTAAKASVMAEVAQGFASIEISAAEAAAAAFADSASLGPAGLAAAPAAAAAAYATVLGFASGLGAAAIPSAAGGMVVGSDGLIMAHAEEMVLPAHLSSGIQTMIEGGAADGGSSGGGAALSPNFNISAVDAKSVVALFNNPNVMRQFARNLSGYMAMNPSVRGAY